MSKTDIQNSELESFDLAEFIHNHSELFVVMGVFGALAIYISQSVNTSTGSDAELMVNTGFVSAFGLAMLTYALIYLKLIDEFGDWNALYRAHFRFRNVPLAAFTLLSVLLILSISFIVTQNEPVVFLIILIGTLGVGTGIVTRIVYGVGRRVPHTPYWRISSMFLASLSILLASLWVRSNVINRFEPTTIHELSLNEPVPVALTISIALVAIIQSLAAIGVLASIVGIPVVIVDKIRGNSPYDEEM